MRIVEQDPRRRYPLTQLVDPLQRFSEQGNGHLPETKTRKVATIPDGIIADGEGTGR